jgi:hypothetical protein
MLVDRCGNVLAQPGFVQGLAAAALEDLVRDLPIVAQRTLAGALQAAKWDHGQAAGDIRQSSSPVSGQGLRG